MKSQFSFLVLLLCLTVLSTGLPTDVSNCMIIDSSGEYNLTADLSADFTCIQIIASNVIFNGNGHWVNRTGGSGDAYGIYVYSAENVTIKNVNVANWTIGISFYFSSNNIITNNTANLNLIGIYLLFSSNNTLVNNTMNNNRYNFGIYGDDISHYYQDINTSNTVDEKPIYYWTNEKYGPNNCKDTEIDESTNAGFVALVGCDNITVKNLNLSNNIEGILLVNTTNSKILNNTINSSFSGILLYSSSNSNLLINNTIGSSWAGIYLVVSSNNTLTNNTADSNNYGIYIFNNSNFNEILNNKISNSNEAGIVISDCVGSGECGNGNINNTIEDNEILNNKIGIFSNSSNSTINRNVVCGNTDYDFYSEDWLSSSGTNNTCSNPDGWKDTGTTGCTYPCGGGGGGGGNVCTCDSCSDCNAKLSNP
ncbi:MAG: NosD domain-containing protein, partial [archaeon]